jgi:hypothetical protein
MSSSQLSLSSLAAAVTPSSTASWLTSSALQSAADQVNASFPMASINPVSLLTTPIGQLLGGGSSAQSSMTALLNGMVANLTSDISNVLSQSQQAIAARLYVPGLTSLIENTILGGTRTLNLLRIISLCGAIPQVLFSKISSGANVPTSFADSGPPPANCAWSVCGLMIVESLISVLEGVRRAAADTNTAGDMFMLETVRLVMVIARGSLTVEMANTWTGVSQTAGVAAGGIEIASAILCLISLTGSRGPTSDWNSILKFDVGVNIAALLAMAGVTIYELVNANYQGAADWASFATQTCCWLLDAGVNSWDLYALMKGETPSELRVTSGLNIAKTTLAIGNAIAEGISNYQQSLGG